MIELKTRGARETQGVAKMLTEAIAASPQQSHATVVALQGELGAGKTTFAQGFARALRVTERVLSPTFVLMKIYGLRPRIKDKSKKIKNQRHGFRHLVHIDCYRLASSKDLLHLGFKKLLKDKDAIILIEWPDRIKKILPSDTTWMRFAHGEKQNERRIVIDERNERRLWGNTLRR